MGLLRGHWTLNYSHRTNTIVRCHRHVKCVTSHCMPNVRLCTLPSDAPSDKTPRVVQCSTKRVQRAQNCIEHVRSSMVHIGQTFIFWCPVDYYCLLVNSASIWSVHQRPMQSGDRTNSHRTQTCLSDAVPPSSHATEQAAWASAVLKPWDAKSIFLMHRPSCPIHCRELLFFFTSSLVQNC